MKISIQVGFNGQCEAAFAAYARIFDATTVYSLRYGDSPMAGQVPPDWQHKLYHATLRIGELTLMGGDQLPDDYRAPQGCSLVVNPDTPDAARRMFAALADGGLVQMPVQETFWSPAFGVVTDRYGLPWTINCEAEAA